MIALIMSPVKVLLLLCGFVSPTNNVDTTVLDKNCTTSIVYNMEVAISRPSDEKENIKGELEICVNNSGNCRWEIQTKKKYQQKLNKITNYNGLFSEINQIIQLSLNANRGHLNRYFDNLNNQSAIRIIENATNVSIHKRLDSTNEIITLFDKKTNQVVGCSFLQNDEVVSKLLCIYNYSGNLISPSRIHINTQLDGNEPINLDVSLKNERLESL